MPSPNTLICVIGPTAIGKTALAVELAKAFDTEIISADSRQFYKEMTIGTAVPSKEELAAIKHHFIQTKSIKDTYSVGDFEREALDLLSELFQKKDVVVMAGGSGLYLDAVVRGLDDFPEVTPEIRNQLKDELEQGGIEYLQSELKEVDPESYARIDIQNKQRLIRALEIYRGTGKPYSSFLNQKSTKREFNTVFIGLTTERTIVYARINERVDQMISSGLIEEARSLYPFRHLNALQTVGYKELFQWFDNELTKEEAIAEIKKNSRRFAKRQGTWFRKNEAINWFDYRTKPKEIISFLKEKKGL
ncbi:MAG: tRNA (adenosine(37)-N6)-dimethylallyltransferase MiaA [Bacteroidia bacterium]|nr:tRNA (adenosine(37)-N6)-dimethylallyltransferase MiaA [Bacteroidia bacterium]MBT8276877.1 tRNA (adenosine(37)-N6)-dimethylallyltransferase MiaA [Bacteroidia bacterium]NNF31027.1 tRNA (adenosine(37)-N6)-dimethylallyltransferase MiaA [Flavobacteriaceae bacterium]NNK53095.1 tRNA (adenosine(37)-N6)-dimethylallyltransferase MiaA [Flavobacteriaceae bacterium]NNM08772.1 tRNA (adenosine(37)-N6)-dimethylallyltransferase MiaA [Flavobacteriaceae bacterium]